MITMIRSKIWQLKNIKKPSMSLMKDCPMKSQRSLNAAVLLDIDAELSTNKPSDAEIRAEVRGEAIQEEDDIDVVYDEPPAPPSAFEVEKAIEVLQQFTLFATKEMICEKFYQK